MELKEIVISFIGKTLNKSAEEVSSLLFTKEADTEVVKPDALTALYELDKARVQGFENKVKEQHDKGYSKAKAEELSKYEKGLREKYQITEEKQGTELWDAIATKLSKDSGAAEPTEDQVKRSKVYLDTLDALTKEKQKVDTEWKTKYEGREKQLQKEATFKTISDQALSHLDKLNPVLPDAPEDEAIRKELKNVFLSKINEFDFEIKDGKTIVLTKEADGSTKVLLDEHGHPVQFENLVKQKASTLFRFKAGEQRQGTGNNNDDNGSGAAKGYTGPKPKDDAEYAKMIAEAKDDDTRIAITKLHTGK